jgi:steroid 5-alpha reductase family enzyme
VAAVPVRGRVARDDGDNKLDNTSDLFVTTAATTAALMLGVWLLSLLKRDAGIVDIFWGLGFTLIAWVCYYAAGGYGGRRMLIAALTTVWGARLAIYIFLRNRGKGEDFRYQTMRHRFGNRFPIVSLFVVFGLQGVLMWVISLPLQVAQVAADPPHFTWLDILGAAAWSAGFLFEAVGDYQLARFKADPANKGKVMNRGLWAYTRHPNYFGDALLWWGLFLIALSTRSGLWTIISPLVMTGLLMKVSGVALLEKTLKKTKPEYEEYARRTSAFVPWPPKK